jgi:hypothetical protein
MFATPPAILPTVLATLLTILPMPPMVKPPT